MSEFIFKLLQLLTYIGPSNIQGCILYSAALDEASCCTQDTLCSKANRHLSCGNFEKLMVRFHNNMAGYLEKKCLMSLAISFSLLYVSLTSVQ